MGFWAHTDYNQYIRIYNIQLYGLSIWIIINGLNLMGYIQIHTVFCHPGVDRIWTIPYSTYFRMITHIHISYLDVILHIYIYIYKYIMYIYIYIHTYYIYIYYTTSYKIENFGDPNSAFPRPGAHGPVEPEAFGSAGPHCLLGTAPRARPGPRESARERGGLAEARRGLGDGRILGKSTRKWWFNCWKCWFNEGKWWLNGILGKSPSEINVFF